MVRDDQPGVWANLLSVLDTVPEDSIAVTVYIVGALIILWCWYSITRRMPKPIGGILWIILFALVASPTISEGPNSDIAPATFGLLFGILTKDSMLIWSNLSIIAFVMGVGLILGYLWSKFNMNQQKRRKNVSPL